ncbi:MAG: TIGR03067 domain-containing protein [Verrucomicrobiota bacterium]
MKTFKTPFLSGPILTTMAGLALLFAGPGFAGAADAPVSDKALQGVWRGARFGAGKGEDPSKGVKLELTIKDSHITCKKLPDGQAVGEGDLKVSADGKTIEAVGSTGNFKGKAFQGILKLEGNTLTWCTGSGGQERPTEFAGDGAKKNWLIIVKREP